MNAATVARRALAIAWADAIAGLTIAAVVWPLLVAYGLTAYPLAAIAWPAVAVALASISVGSAWLGWRAFAGVARLWRGVPIGAGA